MKSAGEQAIDGVRIAVEGFDYLKDNDIVPHYYGKTINKLIEYNLCTCETETTRRFFRLTIEELVKNHFSIPQKG